MDTVDKLPLGSTIDRKKTTITQAKKDAKNRSQVTNDVLALPDVDGRRAIARRFRDIVNAIVVDQGGIDRLSETRLQLIRRFAAAAVIAEQMEAKLAAGGEISVVEHSQLASTLVRIAARIGVSRIPRDITLDPLTYARELDAEIDGREEGDA